MRTPLFASLVAITAASSPALAEVELTSEAGSAEVRELEHDRQLVARPLWLEVADTHRFRNTGRSTLQLIYRFDLPEEAAVSGVEVKVGNRTHRAVGIDSAAAIRPLPEVALGEERADLALLRQIDPGRYELTIYPLDPNVAVTAVIRSVVPAALSDGRMSVELPARGASNSANLAATRVTLRASGWRAVKRLDELTLNGQRSSSLTIAAGDRAGLAIQARAVFGRGGDLDAGLFALELDGGLHALAIAGAAPPASRVMGEYLHVVLLVDVSASIGRSGLRAAAAIADGILAGLPPSTRVAVVPFNRAATSLRPSFRPNDHTIRGAVADALKPDRLANGSDLLAALAETDRLLASREARRVVDDARVGGEATAAVIAISDGSTPIQLTGERAYAAVSEYVRGEAVFFAVTVARDGRSFPQPLAGALGQLISRTGGAAFGVPASAAATRAPAIVKQLGIANQLLGLRARIGEDAASEIDLPDQLGPGSGFMTITPWAGPVPKAMTLTAARRGGMVTYPIRRLRDPALESTAGALGLHRLDPPGVAQAHERAERRGGPEAPLSPERDGARQIARAGARLGVATPFVSLVIPNPTDRLAREQLALAKKWGSWLYRRAPTPAEIAGDLEHRLWRGATTTAIASAQRAARAPGGGNVEPAVMRREVRTQLFRRVRSCYDRELRSAPRLRGSLTLQLDIADGEVREAEISAGSIGRSRLRRCVIDAAYRFKPPQAANDHATTYVVRYPFRFRVLGKRGDVSEDDGMGKQIELDPDDPLDGID